MSPNDSRRRFLQLGLAAGSSTLCARFAFAAPATGDARFVFIILRGALDGLSAVPPYADPDYPRLRDQLAIGAPGSPDGALALDGQFGLNPGLSFVHEAYLAHEALIFHALATPYRERSHFDGQDVLETGLVLPHAGQVGWLNRAATALPPRCSPRRGTRRRSGTERAAGAARSGAHRVMVTLQAPRYRRGHAAANRRPLRQ